MPFVVRVILKGHFRAHAQIQIRRFIIVLEYAWSSTVYVDTVTILDTFLLINSGLTSFSEATMLFRNVKRAATATGCIMRETLYSFCSRNALNMLYCHSELSMGIT